MELWEEVEVLEAVEELVVARVLDAVEVDCVCVENVDEGRVDVGEAVDSAAPEAVVLDEVRVEELFVDQESVSIGCKNEVCEFGRI